MENVKRRTIADAIEALDGMAVPVRGVECTVHVVYRDRDGRGVPVAVPTVAGRCCRAYRSLPMGRFGGTKRGEGQGYVWLDGFRMSETDATHAVIVGFGSMHAADRFLAGEGVANA